MTNLIKWGRSLWQQAFLREKRRAIKEQVDSQVPDTVRNFDLDDEVWYLEFETVQLQAEPCGACVPANPLSRGGAQYVIVLKKQEYRCPRCNGSGYVSLPPIPAHFRVSDEPGIIFLAHKDIHGMLHYKVRTKGGARLIRDFYVRDLFRTKEEAERRADHKNRK